MSKEIPNTPNEPEKNNRHGDDENKPTRSSGAWKKTDEGWEQIEPEQTDKDEEREQRDSATWKKNSETGEWEQVE